jgi:hypothetical protein
MSFPWTVVDTPNWVFPTSCVFVASRPAFNPGIVSKNAMDFGIKTACFQSDQISKLPDSKTLWF